VDGLGARAEGRVGWDAGFIVASLLVLFGIPRPGSGAYLQPVNSGLTEWRKSAGIWQLEKYNEAWHLTPAG